MFHKIRHVKDFFDSLNKSYLIISFHWLVLVNSHFHTKPHRKNLWFFYDMDDKFFRAF